MARSNRGIVYIRSISILHVLTWVAVTNSPRLGGSRQAPDTRCFKVLGLRTNTVAASIRDVFQRWGTVERVELNLDENEMPDGTAIVLYKYVGYFLMNQSCIDS